MDQHLQPCTGPDKPFEALSETVADCYGAITYRPLAHEPSYANPSFPFPIPEHRIEVPADAGCDPFEWADRCQNMFQDQPVLLLIPGTRFDIHGTRHGSGGGWYDRFLSSIPRSWLRIGIANNLQFCSTPLERRLWDEPVDWILVYEKELDHWNVHRSVGLPSEVDRS